MIDKKETSYWFQTGRGDVSAKVAKSGEEVLSQESEIAQEGLDVMDGGASVNDYGAKPIYPTGATPFHTGRGNGRGSVSS